MFLDREKYFDVMIDLETLGTTIGSPVFALGACEIAHSAEVPTFYQLIKPQGVPSISTFVWWVDQARVNPDAAKALMVAYSEGRDESSACWGFNGWIGANSEGRMVRIWGNGASFDEPLLRAVYERNNLKPVWSFRDSKCYRTMRDMFGHLIETPESTGTIHNALDDAWFQAETLVRIDTVLRERS